MTAPANTVVAPLQDGDVLVDAHGVIMIIEQCEYPDMYLHFVFGTSRYTNRPAKYATGPVTRIGRREGRTTVPDATIFETLPETLPPVDHFTLPL